jgi:succinyl-CoA synthetase alpha subunit
VSIFADRSTRLVVQGITGRDGSFHTRQMVEYGTQVVAGVTPGKGGQKLDAIPIFDTVEQAVRETGANTSVVYVPPAFAADAMFEAADAGISLIATVPASSPPACRRWGSFPATSLIPDPSGWFPVRAR